MEGLKAPSAPLDLGNSGTSMRLLAGLLCGQRFAVRLTGDESLSRRPMKRITEPLMRMGAMIETTPQGTAPLALSPVESLHGIDFASNVASAQIKSAILLAGMYAKGKTRVVEPEMSRDHTERMLAGFGYSVQREGLAVSLQGGGRLKAMDVVIPSDISSAAFLIVAALIAPTPSESVIRQVGINPTRTGVIEILRLMGGKIELENQKMVCGEPVADLVVSSSVLHGIAIPEKWVPYAIDEFPAIFIAAAAAKGKTELTGAAELRVKESDRIQVMADGLKALGISAQAKTDGMIIHGQPHWKGAEIQTCGDHRVAMSFAVASLRARSEIILRDCANIQTSFPGFADLVNRSGLDMEVIHV
jgi:3-phosphoshikimate 1-carboxyvinyltransferase